MFSRILPWNLYQKELSVYGYGYPLWEPNPPYVNDTPQYRRVEVGDVGLLKKGSFELLFNIFLPADHPRQFRGVPSDFHPLTLPGLQFQNPDPDDVLAHAAPRKGAVHSMPLQTDNVRHVDVALKIQGTPGPVPVEVGTTLEVTFTKKHGAILMFEKPAPKYEMTQDLLLEQYVMQNYRSWVQFARMNGFSVFLSDLFVVTGMVRTKSWNMAVSKNTRGSFSTTVRVSMPGVFTAGAGYQTRWQNPDISIITNEGPDFDTLGGIDNQTLFFNAVVAKGRGPFPTKIRAAAGYHQLPPADRDANPAPQVPVRDGDEDVRVMSVPDYGKDTNVVSPILDYILDACPTAEIALARDSDLMPYVEGRYDEEEIRKRLLLFAPTAVLCNGAATLKHQPYSVMLHKLVEQGVEHKSQSAQELLRLAYDIRVIAESIAGNRFTARHLSEWCSEVAFFATQAPNVNDNETSLLEVTKILRDIERDFKSWTLDIHRASAIALAGQILYQIQQYHMSISLCCSQCELRTQSRIEQADVSALEGVFKEAIENDRLEVLQQLCNETAFSAMLAELPPDKIRETLHELAGIMQESLSDFDVGDARRTALERNLHMALGQSGELLPSLDLCRGEVQRTGDQARTGTPKYDIWEGVYLSTERVMIKAFRSYASSTEDSASEERYRYRFNRETRIWHETWLKDKGQHLVPFLGYCTTDRRCPYLVSPYYTQTADNYVKVTPGVDCLDLLFGVAKGIEVLHSFDPPVIHGSIKGANIFIAPDGRALLGNFGFSKLMEDVMGEAFTNNEASTVDVRWRPPERWKDQGILSIEGDIYEFAMTMLELLTHEIPFKNLKYPTEVIDAVTRGKRPLRPTDPEVIGRGLTDDVWDLMEACWKGEREARPEIGSVLAALKAIRSARAV